MSGFWARPLALAVLVAAFASSEAGAAKRACGRGSVRLSDGYCCPRGGVTRNGACVSGALAQPFPPPGPSYCLGGGVRDALGRCASARRGLPQIGPARPIAHQPLTPSFEPTRVQPPDPALPTYAPQPIEAPHALLPLPDAVPPSPGPPRP